MKNQILYCTYRKSTRN